MGVMETNLSMHTLPGGLRVAVEPVSHARSVAVGVWIGAGSHYEQRDEAGAAHFLEHMLFKGTSRHSARELADRMDRLGGEFNATTGRESTCYYGWVLTEYWREALQILAELVLDSKLDPQDVERERQVILEEITGDEDVLETKAMQEFDRALWGRHPLGRPVAGSARSVEKLTREQLMALHRDLYTPDNAVVSLAGPVTSTEALAAVQDAFGSWNGRKRRRLPRPGTPGRGPGVLVRRRRVDQAHLVFGTAGPTLDSPPVYDAMVLSTLLGGGVSSRLFQRIREEEGLAYSVYSFHEAHLTGGILGVYAAVNPDNARRAADLIRTELARVAAEPVPEAELQRARAQLKSSVILGLESMTERMNRMGEHLVLLGRVVSAEEVAGRVDAVTPAGVLAAARAWLEGPQAVSALGPLTRADLGLE